MDLLHVDFDQLSIRTPAAEASRLERAAFFKVSVEVYVLMQLLAVALTLAWGWLTSASAAEAQRIAMVLGLAGIGCHAAWLAPLIARRLRDLNRSRWLALVLSVPAVGWVLALVLLFGRATTDALPGRNTRLASGPSGRAAGVGGALPVHPGNAR